jgi:hypothetical protein
MDNLTAPVERQDRLVHGRHGFGAAWVRHRTENFAAPNHSRGIERQDAYCSDVKL